MSGLRYTEDHEWLRPETDGTLTVGITAYAQEQLGDIVFVDLPAVGRRFAAGEEAVVIESVKAAADIKMPVTGEIVAVNAALAAAPETVNGDPLGAGRVGGEHRRRVVGRGHRLDPRSQHARAQDRRGGEGALVGGDCGGGAPSGVGEGDRHAGHLPRRSRLGGCRGVGLAGGGDGAAEQQAEGEQGEGGQRAGRREVPGAGERLASVPGAHQRTAEPES